MICEIQDQNSHRIVCPRCWRRVYGSLEGRIFAYPSLYQALEGKRPRERHIYMDSHQVQVLPPIWIAKQPAIIWAAASCGGTFGGTLASSSGKILIPYRLASRFESSSTISTRAPHHRVRVVQHAGTSDRIRIAFIFKSRTH